jgi:hypothetical protein
MPNFIIPIAVLHGADGPTDRDAGIVADDMNLPECCDRFERGRAHIGAVRTSQSTGTALICSDAS